MATDSKYSHESNTTTTSSGGLPKDKNGLVTAITLRGSKRPVRSTLVKDGASGWVGLDQFFIRRGLNPPSTDY